ncbi:glycosyltransferase family 4 protein [Leeuwenhoekiella aequorea]|uniref:Glycosyltransferase involved in cell wall biosynthesis n=1 Tax=Leeuwenhoekiella aequorea TaxID=283736 RepID=A0A4Q0PDH9_9FLAO|nr:glycosyltransferase family 4 protein [Leeuwenhoekiella aequorea]RXG24894.1 glycosyltransferase involved in cell wall biosynthesis [Leeuwenhoekiella aequorea]
MDGKNLNIALFSPAKNPYSETFIQAQKNNLKGNVFYFYGSGDDIKLEGEDFNITQLSFCQKLNKKISHKPVSQFRATNIVRSLKKNRIDVVLVQYGNHAHHLMPVFKQMNIGVVVHFHGYDASVKNVILSTNTYKEVFSRSTYIIAVSKKMKEMLLDLGCPEEKLILNIYGPNPLFLKVKPACSEKTIIAIGRFVDKKAPHLTILAFSKVLEKHPDAILLMGGSGVLYNACVDLSIALGCFDSIRFLNIIKPEEFQEVLSRARCFVQHSKIALNGDMEGTPVAVLEACAAGVPVVSTYHAGIPDVIQHGKTGLLSVEGDIRSMAEHIIQLLDNPDYAKQLGQAGKKRIKNHFSMERYITKLDELIRLSSGL